MNEFENCPFLELFMHFRNPVNPKKEQNPARASYDTYTRCCRARCRAGCVPAAGLVGYAPQSADIHVVDPNIPLEGGGRITLHQCGAVEGLTSLERMWTNT